MCNKSDFLRPRKMVNQGKTLIPKIYAYLIIEPLKNKKKSKKKSFSDSKEI